MTSKTLLALETSSTVCGVSIAHGEDILSLTEELVHRKHAEILPKFIESALQQGQKSFEELDAIAVSIGPGSFTGLRIGLGFAKGMAYAHGLPIIQFPPCCPWPLDYKMTSPQGELHTPIQEKYSTRNLNGRTQSPRLKMSQL